jgi:hypothetical protein
MGVVNRSPPVMNDSPIGTCVEPVFSPATLQAAPGAFGNNRIPYAE